MLSNYYIKVTINLHKLARRLRNRNRKWIHVKELAEEIGVSTKVAGRILTALERLGYVEKRNNRVYKVKTG